MSIFKFKEFVIKHDNSAMKVGTDGVLLGSWASCLKSDSILDIGSESGFISLMLGQRTVNTIITGIEIDKFAANEAKYNINNSPWSERIQAHNISLQRFSTNEKFDLIISNPPFFSSSQSDKPRCVARHHNTLSFSELIHYSSNFLAEYGVFSVIIPFDSEYYFCQKTKEYGLFCNRACYIKGNEKSKIKRVMLEFSFANSGITKEYLTIEKSRHNYTEAYVKLCKGFYLDM